MGWKKYWKPKAAFESAIKGNPLALTRKINPKWDSKIAQDNPLKSIAYVWGEITGKNRQYELDERNYLYSREKYEYDKQLQKDVWAREDNAVWRRQQDLLRSGLSPVLAAGGAAQVGPVVQTTAPHIEARQGPDLTQLAQLAMQVYTMKADVARTLAQEQLFKLQGLQTISSTRLNNMRADGEFFLNVQKKIDAINSARSGIGKEAGQAGKLIRDLEAWLDQFRPDYINGTTNSNSKNPRYSDEDFKFNWRGQRVLK